MGFLSFLEKSPVLGGIAGSVLGSGITGMFSKSSAKSQMQFQKYMSDTAHQREVRDLKLAGLNPILSAKYGGASTPAGAGYQVPDLGGAVSSAPALKKMYAELQQIQKTTDNTMQDTDLKNEQEKKVQDEREYIKAQTNQTNAQIPIAEANQVKAKAEAALYEGALGVIIRAAEKFGINAGSAKSLIPKGKNKVPTVKRSSGTWQLKE